MRTQFHKILNALEAHLRTDVRYVARGSFWLMLGYTIQVATGVITTVVLANLLSKDALGLYQYVLATAAIISVFTLSGLGTAITRGVAKGHDGIIRSGVKTKLKWSIGIVTVSASIAAYYFYKGNFELGTAFLIVGACAPFIESFKLYENFLFGKEAFKDSVTLGAWRKPLPLLAITITAWLYPEPVALVAIYFVSNAISLWLVYMRVVNKYQPSHEYDRETITLGKHLSIFSIISRIANQADKLLLWHLLGPAAVASFSIAQFSSRYAGGFLSTLTALALPKLTKRDLHTLQHTLPRKIRMFTILMVIGVGIYILVAPLVFPLLFPMYPESIVLSQILACAFIFTPRSLYNKALIAHTKTRAQYILNIAEPTIKLIMLAVLIPRFDMWGAVYAPLVSGFIGAMLSYYFFKQAAVSAPVSEQP